MATGSWQRSSHSNPSGGNCVEMRLKHVVELRDSKLGEASPILTMTRSDFAALLAGVK